MTKATKNWWKSLLWGIALAVALNEAFEVSGLNRRLDTLANLALFAVAYLGLAFAIEAGVRFVRKGVAR